MKKKLQRTYKCLSSQEFSAGNYKLVPIRDKDKYVIMQWRNEQIDILRQKQLLTKEQQKLYFRNTVDKLFEQKQPNQLLFSFLENDILVGYGGLVHIDWESRNAEISFLTETKRSLNKGQFIKDWENYLRIIKKTVDLHLSFKKIYTYAYNLRPNLYKALIKSGFVEEGRLKEHVSIKGGIYDVLIHSFFFEDISFRMANKKDVRLYYKWTNDPEVRRNSFNVKPIQYREHHKWFFSKLSSGKCFFYLFLDSRKKPVGQVRIENLGEETIIGVSIDKFFRRKSISSKMLIKASNDYLSNHRNQTITAYIKYDNIVSYKSFLSAGFFEQEVVNHNGIKSFKLGKN
jgi:RimJ/RimL family protein N-acetyltransferase